MIIAERCILLHYNIKHTFMMRITQIFLAVVLLAISSFNSYAQGKLEELMEQTTPQERAEMQTKNMTEMLSLTEDQKEKVGTVNLRYAERMQSVHNSGQGRLQRLRQMKAISGEKDLELKKIFTPAQYEKYSRHKEEMKENMRAKAKERNR
jgi:periplasmic protein CpxP/Spy